MSDYEKMSLQELWTEYQKLSMAIVDCQIRISKNQLKQDSIVSWIMGKTDEAENKEEGVNSR